MGHPLVKIDTEGHESHVLAGMRQLTQRDLPILIVETSNEQVIAELTSLGYAYQKMENSPNILFTAPRGNLSKAGVLSGLRIRRAAYTPGSMTASWLNRADGGRIWPPDTEVVGGHTVHRHPVPNCRTASAGMEVEVVKL